MSNRFPTLALFFGLAGGAITGSYIAEKTWQPPKQDPAEKYFKPYADSRTAEREEKLKSLEDSSIIKYGDKHFSVPTFSLEPGNESQICINREISPELLKTLHRIHAPQRPSSSLLITEIKKEMPSEPAVKKAVDEYNNRLRSKPQAPKSVDPGLREPRTLNI